MADASVVAPLFPLPFAGKNVRTTSEKKATKKGGGSGWMGWLGGEDCPGCIAHTNQLGQKL